MKPRRLRIKNTMPPAVHRVARTLIMIAAIAGFDKPGDEAG